MSNIPKKINMSNTLMQLSGWVLLICGLYKLVTSHIDLATACAMMIGLLIVKIARLEDKVDKLQFSEGKQCQ